MRLGEEFGKHTIGCSYYYYVAKHLNSKLRRGEMPLQGDMKAPMKETTMYFFWCRAKTLVKDS